MKIPPYIHRLAMHTAALFFIALAQVSCNTIYDDEGDCNPIYEVAFRYDMNMKYADALAHEVSSITLYVFAEDGTFIKSYTENSGALQNEGYRMSIDLPPGSYRYVVWGGQEGQNHSYHMPRLTPGTSQIEELTASLNTGAGGVVTTVDPLFHSTGHFSLPNKEGVHTTSIQLTKNTNLVKVVLQNLSGSDLDINSFHFTITAENGVMNYDNTISPTGEFVTYRPFSVSGGKAEIEGGSAGATISTVLAEFTIGRLTTGGESPLLTITNDKGERLLSIPLVDYVLLVKGKYNESMSDQEYLDRQDEYSLVFLLDDRGSWISTQVIINGWKIVLNDVEL